MAFYLKSKSWFRNSFNTLLHHQKSLRHKLGNSPFVFPLMCLHESTCKIFINTRCVLYKWMLYCFNFVINLKFQFCTNKTRLKLYLIHCRVVLQCCRVNAKAERVILSLWRKGVSKGLTMQEIKSTLYCRINMKNKKKEKITTVYNARLLPGF